MIGSLVALTLTAGLSSTPLDPRVPFVELQIERDHAEALRAVESALAERTEEAHRLGFDYLRGHLLLQVDRPLDALEAFVASLSSTPSLSAYGRFRLALEQAEQGQSKVAAGLLASLLGSRPPRDLALPAMRLFQRTLDEGADCRLLGGLVPNSFSGRTRRLLILARAGCAARDGNLARSEALYFQLLEEDRADEVARPAAERLAGRAGVERGARPHMLIGLAFHHHREFERAIQHLARTIARLPETSDLTSKEEFDTRYALARSHFWQGRYSVAAAAFSALARRTRDPGLRAQVLYQQGRCLELDGDWSSAIETYRAAHRVQPTGGWSDSAVMSQLRLLWRSQRETDALAAYQHLVDRRRSSVQVRALLFFASSDLVQGRADRAGSWLTTASRLSRGRSSEIAYWQGRLAELRGIPGEAIDHYLDALIQNAYNPFAQAAHQRLEGPGLRAIGNTLGRRLAGSSQRGDLLRAWYLLGDDESLGRSARSILRAQLETDVGVAPFLQMRSVPTDRWPLWRAPLRRPEEMLLALGLWREGASAVMRHFPVDKPRLAFTGSLLLSMAGENKRSLYIAEVLAKRVPSRVPPALLPTAYRRLLYPFSYSYLILREAGGREVDPFLLAAIIREESRFDPQAFSAASARGLTQFVLPTAKRLAPVIDHPDLEPHDLHQPEVAVALGAAYLEELGRRFDGRLTPMIAAYNAGEPQSELWQRYCFSDDPAELLTKITFRETRNYAIKVLTSRAHYTELYAGAADVLSREPTVGGMVSSDGM